MCLSPWSEVTVTNVYGYIICRHTKYKKKGCQAYVNEHNLVCLFFFSDSDSLCCRALHWVTIQMLCVSMDEEIPEVSENVVKAITGQRALRRAV